MSSDVVLSHSQRSSLLSLKQSANLTKRTQSRLSTGLQVASVIDDPVSFFQAKSLSDRANDFISKKDDVDQAASLLMTTLGSLDSIEDILNQLKGIALGAKSDPSPDYQQFDMLINQLNNIVSDSIYGGINLLENRVDGTDQVSTTTKKVEFSNNDNSYLDLNGQFAGATYYLRGGDNRMYPDETGENFTADNVSTGLGAMGDQFQVNTSTTASQFAPDVAGLSNGGYVITWHDSNDGLVKGQMYDKDGNATGSEINVSQSPVSVNATTTEQNVTQLENGGFAVTWNENNGGNDNVLVRVFDANGNAIGNEQVVNATIGAHGGSDIIGLDNGGFLVSWADANIDGSSSGIALQYYDASGNKVGSEITANQTTANIQNATSLARLNNGNIVVGYSSDPDNNGQSDVVFRIFDQSGAAVGSEITVAGSGDLGMPKIAALNGGGFAISWDDLASSNIMARVYDSSGTSVSAAFMANTTVPSTQALSTIASTADGGFVVSWADNSGSVDTSGFGVIGQRFDASGTMVGSETVISSTSTGDQSVPNVASVNGGAELVFAFQDNNGLDGDNNGIFARQFAIGFTGGAITPESATNVDYERGYATAEIGGVTQTFIVEKQGLGIVHSWYYKNLSDTDSIQAALNDIADARDTVRSMSKTFGSNLTLLQTRLKFSEAYINTLESGADKLTLANLNEEGANLLALQTRTQLSTQALSFAGQTQSSILTLF